MEANGHMTAEDIWAVDDLKVVDLDVPEWGKKVWLRTLKGQERDAFEAQMSTLPDGSDGKNMQNFRARLAARVLCNADGVRLFKDADAPRLGTKSGAALSRIFDKACDHNHLLKKDVEELVGNSPGVPNESSG